MAVLQYISNRPQSIAQANQELIMLLAKKFKVPKSAIGLKSGFSSRNKLVEIPIEPATYTNSEK